MLIKIKELVPVMEALLYDGTNIEEVKHFIPNDYNFDGNIMIKKNDYSFKVKSGNYIVKDVDGTIMTLSRDELMLNYEVVE